MDLSVIIPCHDSAPHIVPLLWSLNRQELGEYSIQLIFVLDACSDNTQQVISDTIDRTKYNVVFTTVDFRHPGASRNFGLSIATGEYIWFVDSDDWLLDVRCFADIIGMMRNENLRLLRIKYLSNLVDYYSKEDLDQNYWMMLWQYVFRKDFIVDFKQKESGWDEDLEFIHELFTVNNIDQVFTTLKSYYYYNYCRPDSRMFNRYGDVTLLQRNRVV